MKKTLLAVAVAAALPTFAQAQSNVTLSGWFKTNLSQTKFSNGASGNGSATGFEDGASRFIISGTEDLGQGLKAIFMLDNRFRVDDNNGATGTVGTGAVFVGLEGGFGKVRTGKIDLYYTQGTDDHAMNAVPLQHWNVSLLSFVNSASVPIARTSRSSNVIRYDLPSNLVPGLNAGAYWSPAASGGVQSGLSTAAGVNCAVSTNAGCFSEGVPGASKGQTWGGDVNFARGPYSVGAAYWDEKAEGVTAGGPTGAGQKAWRIFGAYDFGIAKVGLTYDESTIRANAGDTKRPAWSIPVSMKLGTGTAYFTYTQANDTKTAGNKNNDTGAKMYVLAYNYPLSKRTSLSASYALLNNEARAQYGLFTGVSLGNLAVPGLGQDTKQFSVGIRHNF